MKSAIERACDAVGGQSVMARILGVTPSAVSQWIVGLRPIPIERCPVIEAATNSAVMRWDMRPTDWHLIWPELVGRPDAPAITAPAVQPSGIPTPLQAERA